MNKEQMIFVILIQFFVLIYACCKIDKLEQQEIKTMKNVCKTIVYFKKIHPEEVTKFDEMSIRCDEVFGIN
jgi:hypothetical protein